MDIVITLFYLLFCISIIYPPTEFVSAGFTIPQVFDGFLGSENLNFIGYHIKRITITVFIHSTLPLGYIFTLWCAGERGSWMLAAAAATALIPLIISFKLISWWESNKVKHPVVKALLPYVLPEHGDWRILAADFNMEFRSVDKVSITLSPTSKFVATQMWLIKVSQYGVNFIKQADCALVATAIDSHHLSTSGEDEVQYVNLEVIPSREDIKKFEFRVSATSLRELHPRLNRPISVPEHLHLIPTLIERFIVVFKRHVDQNPVYYVDEDLEVCIGCMQNQADVKLNRRCEAPPINEYGTLPPCQQCNCRALWCCSCMARWWAARADGGARSWLSARGSCPVCRSVFCLLDVCPVRVRS